MAKETFSRESGFLGGVWLIMHQIVRKVTKDHFTNTALLFLSFTVQFFVLPVMGWSTTAPQIAGGWDHTIALKSDGTLWAWGQNSDGQLGDGTTIDKYTPVQIGTDNTWVSITAGYVHTIALKSDGTLWAWGQNNAGQLGDGTTTNRYTPVQIGTGNTWVSIKSSLIHTIALKSDGTLWAWGWNNYGQLGYNTTEICGTLGNCSTSPTQVGVDTDWVSIVAGGYHSVALKSDGTLWTWGLNSHGELGYSVSETCTTSAGDFLCSTSPTQVGVDTDWLSIAAGEYHTIALKSDRTLWGWGRNDRGQLGYVSSEMCSNPWGTSPCTTSPTQVGVDTDWVTITGGGLGSVALKSDGTLWAWGRAPLGDGTNDDSFIPIQIGMDNTWLAIAGGGNHTIALKSDETLWAWGRNNHGQIGDGTTTNRYSPVLIFNVAGCPDLPVRIAGLTPLYYSTLQAAYDAAGDGDTIQSHDDFLNEDLYINLNKTVTLEGGYDCEYATITGKTRLTGNMTISNGMIMIENFELQ